MAQASSEFWWNSRLSDFEGGELSCANGAKLAKAVKQFSISTKSGTDSLGDRPLVYQSLSQFRAVYCSGAYIPDGDTVVALSLLFEKVHLPNNIEFVRHFVAKYSPNRRLRMKEPASVSIKSDTGKDPFSDLPPSQQDAARYYLISAMRFAYSYSELFGEVLESELFPDNKIVNVELVEQGGPGELNKYRVTLSDTAEMRGGDDEYLPKLIESGYVPVVGRFHPLPSVGRVDEATTKQLAALLAMKSIQMVLPRTRSAPSELILEARDRLRDQLPPFWSSMLKASIGLRELIADSKTHYEVSREATELVDRTIRPAVIDLASKMEKERKDWFYRILSPVRTGLRLLVGNPPMTQQQLLTSALVLASDTCVSIADNMRAIDSLKREAGLSYLLDLSRIMSVDASKS